MDDLARSRLGVTACAACEKLLRRSAYCWNLKWSVLGGSPLKEGKKAFDVSFHNKPECVQVMTQRLDDMAWEKKMYDAIEASGVYFDFEGIEVTEVGN